MEYKKFKIEKVDMVNKTFRLPSVLLERLKSVAESKSISINKLIIQCCEYALDNLDN